MELIKEQLKEIELAKTWNDDAPRCGSHCENFLTPMCELNGCITFGYPQHGCKVCPVYSPYEEDYDDKEINGG